MPWSNDPEARRRSAETYNDPEYVRNKAAVRRRSGGRCELQVEGRRCGSRDRVQCDHILPRSQGGGHDLANLRDLCLPHHRAKTAHEGSGYRRPGDPAPQPRTAW
jgi:5-methylcytosine-specific restriction endonuclease McrA